MSERGIKKWAPYKSLPEHDPKIIEMKKNRNKIEKPTLSDDEIEKINAILTNYNGELLDVSYFENGEINNYQITIKKIDIINQIIISNDRKKYYLKNIAGIKALK